MKKITLILILLGAAAASFAAKTSFQLLPGSWRQNNGLLYSPAKSPGGSFAIRIEKSSFPCAIRLKVRRVALFIPRTHFGFKLYGQQGKKIQFFSYGDRCLKYSTESAPEANLGYWFSDLPEPGPKSDWVDFEIDMTDKKAVCKINGWAVGSLPAIDWTGQVEIYAWQMQCEVKDLQVLPWKASDSPFPEENGGRPVNPAGLTDVPLDSPQIYFKGSHYVKRTATKIIPARFSDEFLKTEWSALQLPVNVARMNSCVKMLFSTESQDIALTLTLMPCGITTFRVYRDEERLTDSHFTPQEKESSVTITLRSSDRKPHRYQIDFPTNAEVAITGLKLTKGAKLEVMKFPDRPVYVALGDSITHGSVGLNGASNEAYAYLLADKLGYDLYNLAVGASKVSVPVGEMLKDWKKIDLITLLIGYNDFSWGGVSIKDYEAHYLKLLEAIRKHHPSTPIFCITLTYTLTEKSQCTGVTPEEYRDTVVGIVKSLRENGDKELFLVHGEQLTDKSCMHDPAHLSSRGNRIFAEGLYREIVQTLKDRGK